MKEFRQLTVEDTAEYHKVLIDGYAEELLKTQFKTPAVTLGTAKEHPWLPKMYESFGFKAYDKVHFRGKQHTTVLFKKDLI